MSSGAKRLVQSLRGRTGGGGRSTGGGGSTRSDGIVGESNVVGSAGSSTSATRLCHYDSGHELDEISVVGGSVAVAGGVVIGPLPTPTTPCHCTAHKYGSGQTLYSIAGLPPAPAAPAHRAHSDSDKKRLIGTYVIGQNRFLGLDWPKNNLRKFERSLIGIVQRRRGKCRGW
ncbi:hypothetical protein HZH66_009835 [Vespula vulgaris]|uniref:Uncharacterized protein n=1 Tax=Vespula vulgaris TaxID=7454 RepID=A0A834N0J5_VESVU|nr:hypothetical protein HZH66_009835 [Vespula vulgaris]